MAPPSPSLAPPFGPRNFWRPRPDMAALVAAVHPRRAPPRPSTYAFLRVPPPRAPSTRPLPCVRRISPMSLAMRTLLFARSTPSAPVARAHRPSNALDLAKRAAKEFSNGATRRQRHLDPPTLPGLRPLGHSPTSISAPRGRHPGAPGGGTARPLSSEAVRRLLLPGGRVRRPPGPPNGRLLSAS